MNMREKWMLITDYENYAVSNIGNIKNVKTNKTLKQMDTNNGYKSVMLCKNNKKRIFRTHRLVAMMFLENPNDKPYINHINGIKTDNFVENLEWCTAKENDNHARKIGLKKQNKPVIITHIETKETIIFESTAECSRFLNSNNGSINRVLTKKRNKHKGYEIKYL